MRRRMVVALLEHRQFLWHNDFGLSDARAFAHSRLGFGQQQLGDRLGIVRDVQPGPGADLNDATVGVGEQGCTPSTHACGFTQPEERVVHEGEDPQPRGGRLVLPRSRIDAGDVGHSAKLGAATGRAHRPMRPSSADGPLRPRHKIPRRAASATAAVREVRPSLRRMFAT